MSLCGLHRRLRSALVGQFATVELTSSPGADRLVPAMRRLRCAPAAVARWICAQVTVVAFDCFPAGQIHTYRRRTRRTTTAGS
ncbi:MAG TPA: iron-containing redox enzyme family protein [Pseudonocardiaceae bacterium]|nr:iron-containing redox enzyme family protein [Pseudonocardiaceae bacterium]